MPGGAFQLIDDHGQTIAGNGVAGELIYRGPNVMMGYASGRADLARGSEVEALRTGDLAERLENGFYRITGRLKRISKISGLRIGHDSLEQALARSGIEAAIVGDDREICALHTSSLPDDRVRKRLAEYSGLPGQVLRVQSEPALPRLISGKTDYEAVRRYFANSADDEADLSTGDKVLALYQQTFAWQQVSPTDSFVSLEGDSLSFVQLTLSLEPLFGSLPRKWEDMSVAELSKRATRAKAPSTIGTDMVIRAAAIFLVVLHHATNWPIPGGAAAMLVMVGFSLGRFQRKPALKGEPLKLLSGIPMVLLPYVLILAGYTIGWGSFPWASALLIGNFGFADPIRHDMLPYLYWFVEIFVQCILILFFLFLIPAVRRFAALRPFVFALGLIAAGCLARFVWAQNWHFGNREIFTAPWNFFLFAFGWATATVSRFWQRMIIFALAVIVMPFAAYYWGGTWIGGWVNYLIQVPVIGLLLFVPKLPAPRVMVVPMLTFAAAGYHIYLFHRLMPDYLPDLLGRAQSPTLFVWGSMVAGIGCGFVAYLLQNRLMKGFVWLSRRMKARSDAGRGAGAAG